jgi:NAD(P)-dependent dehydrogenase (short-subunit alcohol dehydrogenase family)
VLTARDPGTLDALACGYPDRTLARGLDVTERGAARRVAARAVERFGRIDVLVNAAGYGLHAAIEETTEAEARDQMETNFFGALWVTQAVLPVMRGQRSGHIVQVSSAAGGTGFPTVGMYSASKFRLEGMAECLALEVAPFGIAVTILAPSDFRTGFRAACHRREAPIADYREQFAGNLEEMAAHHCGSEAGDPARAARALLDLIDNPHPPLRLLLGNMAFDVLTAHHRRQLDEWSALEGVARQADGRARAGATSAQCGDAAPGIATRAVAVLRGLRHGPASDVGSQGAAAAGRGGLPLRGGRRGPGRRQPSRSRVLSTSGVARCTFRSGFGDVRLAEQRLGAGDGVVRCA